MTTAAIGTLTLTGRDRSSTSSPTSDAGRNSSDAVLAVLSVLLLLWWWLLLLGPRVLAAAAAGTSDGTLVQNCRLPSRRWTAARACSSSVTPSKAASNSSRSCLQQRTLQCETDEFMDRYNR